MDGISAHPLQPATVRAASGLETGTIVKDCFALMGRNSVTFLALIAAAAAPSRILFRVLYYSVGDDSPLVLLMLPLTFLCCLPLYAAIFRGAINDLDGKPVIFNDCLRAARLPLRSIPSVTMTILSVWLLLIVPMAGLAARWAVVAPAALAEGKGFRAGLARSSELTALCRPQMRKLMLMLAGLAMSRALAMIPIWGGSVSDLPYFFIGNWLLPLLLTAFTAGSGAVLYRALNLTRKD